MKWKLATQKDKDSKDKKKLKKYWRLELPADYVEKMIGSNEKKDSKNGK